MSQTDFLGAFPEHLKPNVLQQKSNEEMKQYSKKLYDYCLSEIGKNRFPCKVPIAYISVSKLLTSNETQSAIDLVVDKIKEGGYNVDVKTQQTGMSDWDTFIIITKP